MARPSGTACGTAATTSFVPSTGQARGIVHRGGRSLVIAGICARKIEAISCRVASLIEEGVEPGHIVAVTFAEDVE
jgi:superfamily I DNA/RNA helicase